jgi:hypothetical protein
MSGKGSKELRASWVAAKLDRGDVVPLFRGSRLH